MKLKSLAIATIAALGLVIGACQPQSSSAVGQSQKEQQAAAAKKAAESVKIVSNAEIDNIKKRIELVSKPGLLGYITLLNEAGQPIFYTAVKGKITSSGKRLTPKVKQWKIDRGNWNGTALGPAPSDEGTWGSSSPYIFFWTPGGQYFQWSGKYLYSDKPMRLRVEPLVVNVQ